MRLLDLFCGGGGAGVGYYRAGWDVVGVDVVKQPFYPFEFIQADALSLDYEFLMSFDGIHASPPCQAYCTVAAPARRRGKVYPDLFVPTRRMLIASGLPYIIENVQGSPARGIGLCGSMFGLGVRRHRLFESNVQLSLPDIPCTCYQHQGEYITVAGSMFAKNEGATAMGIDWPIDKFQLKEAIPPAYTEFLGGQLMRYVNSGPFISNRRYVSVSEEPVHSVSRNDNDKLPIIVSEQPENSVSRNGDRQVLTISDDQDHTVARNDEPQRLTVSKARMVPVTRRCGDVACNKPLPQGTARRKYCNDLCRLHAFRAKENQS
jgi:DNA (cytosine-5)-methyltransferase 1